MVSGDAIVFTVLTRLTVGSLAFFQKHLKIVFSMFTGECQRTASSKSLRQTAGVPGIELKLSGLAANLHWQLCNLTSAEHSFKHKEQEPQSRE